MQYHIAIDGPAGSGKSTIAKKLASKLGFTYIDTGSMFRAIALKSLEKNVDLENDSFDFLEDTVLNFENGKIILDNRDVSEEIRTVSVTNATPIVAKNAKVRDAMKHLQQLASIGKKVVMDGRDIGTNVLPNADLKIFLTASVETRAKRRYDELVAKGTEINFEDVKKDVEKRDFEDMNRTVSPLVQASDAVLIDTSDLKIEEVIQKIEELM